MLRLLKLAASACLLLVPQAAGGDRRLLTVLHANLGRLAAVGAVQRQYDAARDFEEALRKAAPVSSSCRPLLGAARSLARAEILQAEGVDRPDPAVTRRGLREAATARRGINRHRAACRPRAFVAPPAGVRELDEPRSGEAFFGGIRARTPPGTVLAEIRVTGRAPARASVRRDRLVYRLRAPSGRYGIRLDYLDARGRIVARAAARDVWLLPASAARATAARRPDEELSRRLGDLARSFGGESAMWLHDLTTGKTAGWNADARFPAASTVKLAVLVAALGRFGPRPERSRVAYDLKALTAWSSNLASNRLLDEIGGSEAGGARIAQSVLVRLGARSSMFTGDYRIGTSVGPSGGTREPPLISSRVTTARDLGRILFQLHSAAAGRPQALKATRLDVHEARVALALLLSSQPTADNLGLFRPAVGRRFPLAQKNGWFSAVRHTAGVLYAFDGPRIAVLLTYRPGLTRGEAAVLGSHFVRLSLTT